MNSESALPQAKMLRARAPHDKFPNFFMNQLQRLSVLGAQSNLRPNPQVWVDVPYTGHSIASLLEGASFSDYIPSEHVVMQTPSVE
jgi:hypothetical protein